jgi:GNAT superfamily N-acetyltransferase
MSTPFNLRLMTTADIGAAEQIRSLIGWNQVAADWQRLLELDPGGCFVVEWQGDPVGTVTTTAYDTALGWIGMLLVHPGHRRQGIGTLLLHHAIHSLQQRGVRCIGLDATPAGEVLYARDGFQAVWALARWEALSTPILPSLDSSITIRAGIGAEAWAQVTALDTASFGVNRPDLLRSLDRQSALTAVALDLHGQVTALGMLRRGSHAMLLGPLVATTPQGAASLLAYLCNAFPGARFFWDIPEPNQPACHLAESMGFKRQRPLTRMILGQECTLPDPRLLYAIADLATG